MPRFSPNPGFVAFCVHPSTSDGVVLELFTHGGIYIAVASRYKVPDFVARRRINLLFLLLPSQVTAMSTVPFVTSTFQATAATPSFCPLRQRYHEKGDDPKASAPHHPVRPKTRATATFGLRRPLFRCRQSFKGRRELGGKNAALWLPRNDLVVCGKGGLLGSNGCGSFGGTVLRSLKKCIPDTDQGLPIGIAASTPVRSPPYSKHPCHG